MIEVCDLSLRVSFPEVDERASVQISFHAVESPQIKLNLIPTEAGIVLGGFGKVVLELLPQATFRHPNYPSGVRYPMVALLRLNGRNALTGEPCTRLNRTPQNYFSAPPQRFIDGYFVEGRVNSFLAGIRNEDAPTLLEIEIFPMKQRSFNYFLDRLRFVGNQFDSVRGLTLTHGGERSIEPVYEDLCSFGDWDQTHSEKLLIQLATV